MSTWQPLPPLTDALLARWPNCPTPDCENKVCLWSGTGLCYKCGVSAFGREFMEARYAETHPSP